MKIKKGDKVLVIRGKDKGKEGTVENVLSEDGKVLVPGINMAKKHLKPSSRSAEGGIVEVPRPVRFENVRVICPKCQKPSRLGYQIEGKKKYRRCSKCKQLF